MMNSTSFVFKVWKTRKHKKAFAKEEEEEVHKSLNPCALLVHKIGVIRHQIPKISDMMNVLSVATFFCKISHAPNIFMIHVQRDSLGRFVFIFGFNTNLGAHMRHLRFVILFGRSNQHENIKRYVLLHCFP